MSEFATVQDILGLCGAKECAAQWIGRFNSLLSEMDARGVARMFLPDGTWRDMLALDQRIKSISAEELPGFLEERLPSARLSNVQLQRHRTEPTWVTRADVKCIELFFEFSLALGKGRGIARIIPDSDGHPRVWNLLTSLHQLAGYEEQIGEFRPKHDHRDRRSAETRKYRSDRRPEVVIIGAGQAGLSVAARLARMGVDAVVLEQSSRVGDNWRARYEALALHNAIWINHLPYLPFPENWPTYLPKDRIAEWLEIYAQVMDLDVWTDCAAESCIYDDDLKCWTINVRHSQDQLFTLSCRHLIIATGVSGKPKIPNFPGLSEFKGQVVHSSEYRDGTSFKGKNALVFGTGASGHDIAQDLHNSGASVTLVQRGSMTVCSIEPSASQVLDALFTERDNDEADLIAASVPYEIKVRSSQTQTIRTRELDAELHAGLEEIGFKLDFGTDATGVPMKYLRYGGGFYLNVGCSDLLISREIGLLQAEEIERFTQGGVRLVDGRLADIDLVVMATGYEAQSEVNRRLLGDALAARIGPVWGMDKHGEQLNVWRRTDQEGLWFMLGNFQQCRFYSKILALQICADLRGLIE